MESIVLKNKKMQHVCVEFSVLDDWCYYLESIEDKSILVYILLLRGITQGQKFLSVATLAKKCSLTEEKILIILRLLEKEKFISVVPANNVSILDVPVFTHEGEEPSAAINVEGFKEIGKAIHHMGDEIVSRLTEKETWNANDAAEYFRGAYAVINGIRYRDKITLREKKHLKDLLVGYGKDRLIKTIYYVLKEWDNLTYVTGTPTIVSLFSYRDRFFSEAEKGRKGKRGQHVSGKNKGLTEW